VRHRSADPQCPVDPGTVPEAMDVITPPGVSQATELDYLLAHPATLEGVFIP
jgi:glucoamylase